MRYAELLPDLTQIPSNPALVLHHARVAYHFQVRDFGEISQNFVLHSISKICVLLVRTQVFEWQHGDAFFWNRGSAGRNMRMNPPENQNWDDGQQDTNN